jgi:neutral ceramidase
MFALRFVGSILLLLATTAFVNATEAWRAGAAKVVITPQTPMWMAGYASRTRPADSKIGELYAKAVVLEDADQRRAVLVTLDLVGIDRDLALSVRKRIAEKHKLDLAQVMVSTSHTHSGPVVAKNLRPMHYMILNKEQQEQVDQYAKWLEDSIVNLVDDATAKLAPCKLSYGSGTSTVAVNRRNNQEPEVPTLCERGELKGPSDHDVPVLAVKNDAGELVAIVFGYACHATVLDGYAWCADYPGFAQAALEAAHPMAVAMFWAGCGGDQNPLPRRQVELAKKYGESLAKSVDEVLAGDMKPITGKLKTSYVEIDLPLAKLPTREELQAQANDSNKYVVARAKHYLSELEVGRSLPQTYPYPIGVWNLGEDVDWIFLGGEVVVDYALRLKSERRQKQTWVAAYSNDVMAYIPSRRVLNEGGYEGGGSMLYYGLPTVWAETVEADIVRSVP